MDAEPGFKAEITHRASPLATGFSTSGKAAGWPWKRGDLVRRAEVHEQVGGSNQGGIAPARRTENVLLFTNFGGKQFGYGHDGWGADGAYHYTGAGQVDDQVFLRGNKTLLTTDWPIRIFKEVDEGGLYEYLGEFVREEDPQQVWYRADSHDIKGNIRSVIVFRLWRLEEDRSGVELSERVEDKRVPKKIGLEQRHVERFVSNPKEGPTEYERREAALVEEYADWLRSQGAEVTGLEIPLPGGRSPLFADLYNARDDELVEAKSGVTRRQVREAFGQILDYARCAKCQKIAVLTPLRPAEDMVDLLVSYGISVIYPEGSQFSRVEARVRSGVPAAP